MNRWLAVGLCWLGCLLFPAFIWAMTLAYHYTGDPEPAPFPYSAVEYLPLADLFYSVALILFLKNHRAKTALIAIPLLLLTAWLALVADMWFTGNYL